MWKPPRSWWTTRRWPRRPSTRPLTVNAGKRKITVTKNGYIPVTRVVNVAGGEDKKLELELRTGTAPA